MTKLLSIVPMMMVFTGCAATPDDLAPTGESTEAITACRAVPRAPPRSYTCRTSAGSVPAEFYAYPNSTGSAYDLFYRLNTAWYYAWLDLPQDAGACTDTHYTNWRFRVGSATCNLNVRESFDGHQLLYLGSCTDASLNMTCGGNW